MSKEINSEQAESDVAASGLLLSVEPLSESPPINLAALEVDDDNAPPDTDTTDTVGDTDSTDDTDTDTSDDADGTDDAG